MSDYEELIKDLESLKEDKYSKFCSGLSGTDVKIMGVRLGNLHELVKKYKDIDLTNYKLNDYYEIRFIFFAVAFKQQHDFLTSINFIKKYSKYWVGWNLSDSTYQYIKLPKDFGVVLPVLKNLRNDKNEYIRRLAYLICFKYEKNVQNLGGIFALFQDDEAYYVQMVESWVLCDLYIYYPEETFMFLKDCKLGKIIVNKAISKIHDSYRTSEQNKEKAKTIKK